MKVTAGTHFRYDVPAVIDSGATTSCIYVPRLQYNKIETNCRLNQGILAGGINFRFAVKCDDFCVEIENVALFVEEIIIFPLEDTSPSSHSIIV